MTWTPTGAGSYIKFSGAVDAEKGKLLDQGKTGTPTFASGDATVPVNTGADIVNMFRNEYSLLKGDGVNLYANLPATISTVGDWSIEFDTIRKNDATLTAQYVMGDTASFNDQIRLYNNGTGSNPELGLPDAVVVYNHGNLIFANALAGIAEGDGFNLKFDVVSNVLSLYVNGVAHATTHTLTNNFLIKSLYRAWSGYASCFLSDIRIAHSGLTWEYNTANVTDLGGGTGNLPQTGTAPDGAATVTNYVAATDFVPQTTQYYDGDVTAIDVVDAAAIQGGDYLKGDGISLYCEFPNLTLIAGETASFDFLQTGTISEPLDSTTAPRMVMYWGATGINQYLQAGQTLVVDGIAGGGGTSTVGEVHHAVATVDSGFTANISRVHRNNASAYGGGYTANLVITQAAGTTIYRMDNAVDNGDSTATVANTGTNTGQGDMTIYNFVAATDIVSIPNNTFNYDLSEGSGSVLHSAEPAVESFIPVLTANIDQGYTLVASSDFGGVYPAFGAFDQNPATFWVASGVVDSTLTITLATPSRVVAFGFKIAALNGYWANWEIEGSTDGVSYTTISTGNVVPTATTDTYYYYPLTATTTLYTHIRYSGSGGVGAGNGNYNIFDLYGNKDIALINSPTWS